ncbi:hypothetical protein F5884DRAFT_857903 [Xylogone sp. PMI_703]|nr:hypothetical protein F5884DRAFT_857903 [Xylogone sp. PMI_703]
MTTLTTVGGWVVVLGLGALYFYITNIKDANKSRRPVGIKQVRSTEARKDAKPRKAVKDVGSDSGDQSGRASEKAQKKKTPQVAKSDVEKEPLTGPRTGGKPERDEEIDNKEFARQLSSAKAGTLLAPKPQNATRQKSVKQSRAQEKKVPVETSSDNATAPSSATGGDADDDQSSLNSPELGATSAASPVSGDVSDMLEAPGQGPSVLRVTEPTGPARPKKEKTRAAFEQVETKKQRQNRKKAELKKQIREEEEKERKVLMEKQRRTAREAEGRPAKDGSAFLASHPPSTSAWAAGSGAAKTSEPKHVELLDTYEPSTKQAPETIYSESELAGSDWQKSLPSEEEQMRIAVEDSNWSVVKGKERGKKKKTVDQDSDEKPSAAGGQESAPAAPVAGQSAPKQKWTTTLVNVESNGEVVESEKDLQDSEWEVA